MMSWIKQIGFFIWSAILFVGGMFAYAKYLDKPESVVNNQYDKIKNKGKGNSIDTESDTNVQVSNEEDRRKIKIFGRRRNKKK